MRDGIRGALVALAAIAVSLVCLGQAGAFRADYVNTGSGVPCSGITSGDLCVPGMVLGGATPFRFEGSTVDGTNVITLTLAGDPSAPSTATFPVDVDFTFKQVVSSHMNTPLKAWWCDTVNTACTQATAPNVGSIGDYDSLVWGTGETDIITTQVVVPDDYASDGTMVAHLTKSATTSDDDTFQFLWVSSGDGDSVSPGLVDEGSVSIGHQVTIDRITWALDGGSALVPNDVLHFHLNRSAGADEDIHLLAAHFEYTPR